MKKALIAVVLTSTFVLPAFAADSSTTLQGPTHGVEQKKAEILQHIDQRVALSQQEKVCVQAAQSHADLMSCREKFRPPKPRDDRQNRNQQ